MNPSLGTTRRRRTRSADRDRADPAPQRGAVRRFRDDDAPEAEPRPALATTLVHLHLPLVEHCARRFRNRGEPFEDLVQVGTIGLIKSIDRFDTDRGVEFSTYATPTIIGEIKRYFRDKGWAIRVPRRLQELRMQIGAATAELTQSLGRSPTPRELAESIGCSVEEIIEGIESSNAYSTLSLDATDDADDGAPSMLDAIGDRRRGARARRDPRVDQAAARPARPAGEADPAAAVLPQHDPVADRRGDRRLPDARLPAAQPHPRAAADVAGGRPELAQLRRRPGPSRRRGVQHAGEHDGGDHRERDGDQRVAVAEAPGQAELDQLGEQTGPRAQPAPGAAPRRRAPARRRTPRRTPPWSPPSSAGRSVDVGQLEHRADASQHDRPSEATTQGRRPRSSGGGLCRRADQRHGASSLGEPDRLRRL